MHSFFLYFQLKDNYNIVFVSAIHQHGSAIGTHMSPPSSSLFYSAWERKEGGGLGEVQRRSRVSARWDADVHICRKGTGDREAGRSITELD